MLQTRKKKLIIRRLASFLVAWAVASVVGMGTAVFAALAGGKVGLFLPWTIFEIAAYGMVDTAVTIIIRSK
jgi:uncharacterized membrane protein YczE